MEAAFIPAMPMADRKPAPEPDWRLQLAGILFFALALRIIFFVGFALGDDWGYINMTQIILGGEYPALEPTDQYAYRPLLLYMFAGSAALFGWTDLGVVAPVIAASLATVAAVFYFVRRLFNPRAAWWCALLFACEPANIIDSTTMTNDVILSFFAFFATGLFLLADRETDTRKSVTGFVLAAFAMILAFLIKISILPALGMLALYSFTTLLQHRWVNLTRQYVFYFSFLLFLFGVCLVYYHATGDLLWQFKSELYFYKINPAYSTAAGPLDYSDLMWDYPTSLFFRSDVYQYFAHGWLFWLFIPAGLWSLRPTGDRAAKFLAWSVVFVFAFFEFYPSDMHPDYIPLPRQLRYFEMLVPALVIVVGLSLYSLSRRWPRLALVLFGLILAHCVGQAAYRWEEYDDSQRDMRDLARYTTPLLRKSNRLLVTDVPAHTSLSFYQINEHLDDRVADLDTVKELKDCYVAVGGARSFWWTPALTFDPVVPPDWVLLHEIKRPLTPLRSSTLRVYYVAGPVKISSLQSKPQ